MSLKCWKCIFSQSQDTNFQNSLGEHAFRHPSKRGPKNFSCHSEARKIFGRQPPGFAFNQIGRSALVELRDISQNSVVLQKNMTSRNSRKKKQKFTRKARPNTDKSKPYRLTGQARAITVNIEVSDSDTGITDSDYVYAVQRQENAIPGPIKTPTQGL